MKTYAIAFVSFFDNEMGITFTNAKNKVEAFKKGYLKRFKEAHPLDDGRPVENWVNDLPNEFEALKELLLDCDMVVGVEEVELTL